MPNDPDILNLSNPLHKRMLVSHVKSLEGIHRVSISKVRARRSLSQNAFMHGVLFVDVAKGLSEAWGVHVDAHQAKAFLKDKFLRKPIVQPETGEVHGWYTSSTADLNVEECGTFIDQCIQFSEMDLGCQVRRPEDFENAA